MTMARLPWRRLAWRRTAAIALATLVALAGGGAAVTTRLASEPGGRGTPVEARGMHRSAPVRIVIPAIDVDAPVVPLALEQGELAAPPRAAVAGWYERGTSPGEPGSAVIVGPAGGHRGGPAVFGRLGRLRPGDRLTVVRADRTHARFSVDRLDPDPADGHPDSGRGGEVSLRLVPWYAASGRSARGQAAGPGSTAGGRDRSPQPVVFATFVR